ncbi:MAG: orotidine-5'-phosphate decarboxylase [Gammaproteobacteria bacterium]|nr:orotidine-5'-phosphate decarboxylase [Gammaproteobacteria bacterium]
MADSFGQRLRQSWARSDSALCVGLDPVRERLPSHLSQAPDALLRFCREVVDATADLVCAFKPNIAFFNAEGAEEDLERLIEHIHAAHPGIPVIVDAKRGDVGSTARMYARELFERYDTDAATVNPFQGWDSIAAFAEHEGRGVVVLCHTSNPTSAWLQEQPQDDPAYLKVAREMQGRDVDNLALVVGATFPEQLAEVRRAAPTLPFLVPGVGAQGGGADELRQVFASGVDANGQGIVVNASRSIIYAGTGKTYAAASRQVAQDLRDQIRRARDRRQT